MEAEEIMTTRIKLRRDTAANWISANPILSAGEPGLETDTRKIKYGDGATAWRDLAYANSKIEGRTPIEIHTQDPSSWVSILGQPRNASVVTGVAYDPMGNVIVINNSWNGSKNNNNNEFATATKFDNSGNILWQRDLVNAESGTSYAYGMAVDSQGNIVISLGQGDGQNYVYVVKLSSDTGNQIWAEGFGHNTDYPAFVVIDNNDNPIVNGFSYDNSSNGGYLLRLNKTDGSVMENVRYVSDMNGYDLTTQGIAVDTLNNVILIGSNYNGDNNDLVVQKLNGIDFSAIWTKAISTINGYDMNGGGVACDGADNIYISGNFTGQDTAFLPTGWVYTMVVMKLDDSGVVQWSRDVKGECDQGGVGIVVGPTDGNLYLASYSRTPVYRQDSITHDYLQTVALACYDSSTGKVLWQNKIATKQLSSITPGDNAYNNSNFDYIQGQIIAMQGDRVAVGGVFIPEASNPEYGEFDSGEQVGWVMQFPASGTPVDVGGWKTEVSRIPGRFQSFQTQPYDIAYDYEAFGWGAENASMAFSNTDLVTTLITQDSNTWTFDLKGDLNLPADGNLALAKKQLGWVNLQGFKYNNSESVYFQGVCADPDGNSYAYGQDNNYSKPYVVKYNPTGEVMWQMNIDNEFNGNIYGYAESAAWDSVNNQLVVVSTNYAVSENITLVTTLDPQTGKAVANTTLDMGQYGLNVYDVQVSSDGVPVVVGQTYGGLKSSTVTVNAETSGVDYLDVLASDFADNIVPVLNDSNWLISGTGIDGVQYISNNTNRYDPVTTTVAVGTGAQFDVTVVSGAYSVVVTAGQGGSGYQVGDKLLISAANVGGGDSSNDLLLNVETVDGGTILTVSVVSGTSAGPDAVYTAQGAAPVPGTGATFWVDKYLNSGTPTYDVGYNVGGAGYKVNDILTISGTQLGGISPDNDIVLTVTGVDSWNGIVNFSVNGTPTPDMSTIRLYVNTPDDVDFSQEGTWQVGYYTGTDGFVWTPTWQKIIGLNNDFSADGEYFTSVSIDADGNIFLGMEAYDYNFFGGSYPVAIVVKLNGDGDIQWSRCLDQEDAPAETPSVAADSEGNVIVVTSDWNYGRNMFKLDPNGNTVWQVYTDYEGVDYPYGGTPAMDKDDNVVVTSQDDYGNWDITKLDVGGNVLFNRKLALGWESYQQEADDGTRWTAVQGDYIWTAGTTYAFADDYYNGFIAKLPLDGSGVDGIAEFEYSDQQVPFRKYTEPYIYGDYSARLELHASSGITSTVSTSSVATIITWPETYFQSYSYAVTEPTAGGVVFADGSRQDTSASHLPQRIVGGDYSYDTNYSYKLQLSDRGRHILLTGNKELWLGNYNEVQFPVGSVLTFVNVSGSTRYVYFDGNNTWMGISGTDTTSYGYTYQVLTIPSNNGGNVVTLMKVGGDLEEVDGNAPPGLVYSRWIACGAGLDITD